MFRATKIWLCLAGAALTVIAVSQAPLSHHANAQKPAPNATPIPNPTPTQDPNDPEPTIDDSFALIGKHVPEFGGMYVDEENKALVVNVTKRTPDIIDRLRQAIRDVFPDEDLPHDIRLRDAKFEFIVLKQWHDKATNVFGIHGVVSTDIDEVENRLVIGVEDEAVRPIVEQVLASAGVPPEGWQLKKMQAPIPGLTDRHRPPVGGLQIGSGGLGCTLGFAAIRDGVDGFVTNAHCTNILGSVDGARFTQPADGVSFIATEIIDPPGRTGDSCPRFCGFGVRTGPCRCRYSDAVFAQYDPGVLRFRRIALPPPGAVAYDGANLPVVREGSPIVGLLMRKVGATTGNTMGVITRTCVDVGQNGTRFIFKCQSMTNIPAAPGDSGSPVFRPVSCPSRALGTNCARLYGINWSAGPVVFSPIGKIQRSRELGPLKVCVTGDC